MRSRLTLAVLPTLLALSTPLLAQQGVVQHTPVRCLKSDVNLILDARVTTAGTPRAYFRREGTEDWCWVDGTKSGEDVRFIIPKYEPGVTLEYYFVTLDGDRTTGKSPQIYRAPILQRCEVLWARHVDFVLTECETGGPGLAAAIGAAYDLTSNASNRPPDASPSSPSPAAPIVPQTDGFQSPYLPPGTYRLVRAYAEDFRPRTLPAGFVISPDQTSAGASIDQERKELRLRTTADDGGFIWNLGPWAETYVDPSKYKRGDAYVVLKMRIKDPSKVRQAPRFTVKLASGEVKELPFQYINDGNYHIYQVPANGAITPAGASSCIVRFYSGTAAGTEIDIPAMALTFGKLDLNLDGDLDKVLFDGGFGNGPFKKTAR